MIADVEKIRGIKDEGFAKQVKQVVILIEVEGHTLASATSAVLPSGANRIGKLYLFVGKLYPPGFLKERADYIFRKSADKHFRRHRRDS